MDGVTMGGGVGLSIHGSHRIATDRTVWAMPETAIGLFPDVGTSYALPRLGGEIGTYLGLTGARIGQGDLKALGIATDIAPGHAIAGLLEDLIRSVDAARPEDGIASAVRRHAIDGGEAALLRHRALIDRCFAFDAVEDILTALRRDGSVFAVETLSSLETMSPTSLKVTLAELRRGRGLDFESCLRMEYRLSQSILGGHDFYEGVRAQLVDKDKRPRWRPAVLTSIDDGLVDPHFRVPASGDLTFGEPPAHPRHEIQD
jgi:enoyl-CoA hydratase